MTGASLLVLQGVDQGSRFAIGSEPVGLGRGAQNQLRILDREVSRDHAVIEWEGDNCVLVDRSSANGTFVNGNPIRRHVLKNGDQIQIGRTVLLFTESRMVDSDSVSRMINLVPEHGDDASRIVGQVGHDAGRELLREATVSLAKRAQQQENLRALYRISEEAVRPSLPLNELLQRILDLTIEAVGADRGCMLVADSQTDQITPRVYGHRRHAGSERMPISTSIVDYVLKKGRGVWTSDAQHDQRFETGQSIVQAGIREAMCVPMRGRFELMGVIYVDITTPPEQSLLQPEPRSRFSEEVLTLLVAIGRQSALAVENNRYQEALVKAERLAAVGQTIANLSHHIKNILQGVRGGSYLIDMGLKNEDNQLVRKGWTIVEKNQDRIYHLVMDMLTYSKERTPEFSACDINEIVSDVCDLMDVTAQERRIELVREFDPNLTPTHCDPEGIHRALLNVVNNALDVFEGRSDGRVVLRTGFDRSEDELFIEVEDNGPGIAEESRQRIFDLFESDKGSRGTGIGLAVSQKILREHGGRIGVASEVGRGSTFRLAWPPHDAAAEDNGTQA